MRAESRFVHWRGEQFRFVRLRDCEDFTHPNPVWGVSRGRQFIGTMPGIDGETTNEFEVRCGRWLASLPGRGKVQDRREGSLLTVTEFCNETT